MPQGPLPAPLMRPLVVLALPGMYLFYKYNQYKRRQQESARRRLTERELQHLHHKIDKLLNKLEENEPELATTQEEECVICINAKATMQTAPCGHKVVCRKCFVKTIQMAVSQRLLPLRCVVCRAKILRLKQEPQSLTPDLSSPESSDPQVSSSSAPGGSGFAGKAGRSGVFPASVSAYSVTSTGTNVSSDGSMPNSDSLYSVSSGTSSISGASSLSGGGKHGIGARCCVGGHCFGGAYPRQPTGALRRSQTHSMKLRLQEYRHGESGPPGGRLPPIRELPPCPPPGPQAPSTRIRCAQKIVTQLETGPPPLIDKRDKKSALSKSTSKSTAKTNPKTTSKASMKSSTSASKISAVSSKTSASTTTKTSSTTAKSTTTASSSATQSKTSIIKNLTELTPSTSTKEVPYKPLQPSPSASGAFKKRLNDKLEKNDNKKNELAEKKREEKEKKRLEKEAKREAKREEEQAKREAKEEKKKAKKEAKLAAAAAKEKKN